MKRIKSDTSLHEKENPELCPAGIHGVWRVVECCGKNSGKENDIIECNRCGQQRLASCTFYEDFD